MCIQVQSIQNGFAALCAHCTRLSLTVSMAIAQADPGNACMR